MSRWLSLVAAVFVILAASVAATGTVANAQEQQPNIAPTPIANSAYGLALSQTCANGRANVTFSWQGNDPLSIQQWLDLSVYDNGFAPGSYISAGPMLGFTSSYTWVGLLAGTSHLARINQQSFYGFWDPSPTFQFVTSNCGGGGAPIGVGGGGPASILNLTCQSSLATASVNNVPPASTQNVGLTALPFDTISCSATVSGQYVQLTWRGPNNDTSSGSQFTTRVGGPKPSNAPYDISLQLDWGGNPAIAHISVTPIAPSIVYPYNYYCPTVQPC